MEALEFTLARLIRNKLKSSEAFTLTITFDRVDWYNVKVWDAGLDYIQISWEPSGNKEYIPMREIKSLIINE